VPPPILLATSSSELEAHWTAHQLGACTEEQLQIRNVGGVVVVTGVAPDAARRRVLADALRASGIGVRVEIRSPESATPPPLGTMLRVTERKLGPAAIPMQEDIARHLQDSVGVAVRSFAHATVTASEKSAVQAWALRQLVAAFPPAVVNRLSASERLRLHAMLAEHLSALESVQTALRERVAQLLPLSGSAPRLAAQASWQPAVSAACDAVDAAHRSVYRLFTVGSRDAEPVSDAKASLATALNDSIPACDIAVRLAAVLSLPVTAEGLRP
jgi:hypothetical protein